MLSNFAPQRNEPVGAAKIFRKVAGMLSNIAPQRNEPVGAAK